MARGGILLILLEIVIGLALVGTVATSTNSGSTALAGFTSAQALVVIIPLIFVAIILFAAYRHFESKRGGSALYFEFQIRRFGRVFARGFLIVRQFQTARLSYRK